MVTEPVGQHPEALRDTNAEGELAGKVRYGFLSYVSRSGSTLLGNLLSGHRDVCVCIEANLPKELFGIPPYSPPVFREAGQLSRYLDELSGYSKLNSWNLSRERVMQSLRNRIPGLTGRQLVQELMECYRQENAPDSRICLYKGSPAMPWDGPDLLEVFPGFRAVHLIRDPRAVYASQRRSVNPYTQRPFARHALQTAAQWQRAVGASARLHHSRWLEVRYEDLVLSTDRVLDEVLDFLGGERGESLMAGRLADKLPAVERQIHRLASDRPKEARIDSWRGDLTPAETGRIEVILRSDMEALGYECTQGIGALRATMIRARWACSRFIRQCDRLLRLPARIATDRSRYLRKLSGMARGLIRRSDHTRLRP